MQIDPKTLPPEIRYKLLVGSVVPRPIAVVSSQSIAGVNNIAPFSFFNVVSPNPMAFSFSISGPKPDGGEKDTLRNVKPVSQGGTGELVINIASQNYAVQMAKSASSLPYGESEFDFTGLTPEPSVVVKPPRIGEALISYECKTLQIVAVGSSHLVLAEVVFIHVNDSVINERYRIDTKTLAAIGRMAGSQYCTTLDVFELNDSRAAP